MPQNNYSACCNSDPMFATKMPYTSTKTSLMPQLKRSHMSQIKIPHAATKDPTFHKKDLAWCNWKILCATTKKPRDTSKRSHGLQINIPHTTTNDPCKPTILQPKSPQVCRSGFSPIYGLRGTQCAPCTLSKTFRIIFIGTVFAETEKSSVNVTFPREQTTENTLAVTFPRPCLLWHTCRRV